MTKTEVLALISEKIKANGKGEITAEVLAEVLGTIVESEGELIIIDVPNPQGYEGAELNVSSSFRGVFDVNNPQKFALRSSYGDIFYFRGAKLAAGQGGELQAFYGKYYEAWSSGDQIRLRYNSATDEYFLYWEDEG